MRPGRSGPHALRGKVSPRAARASHSSLRGPWRARVFVLAIARKTDIMKRHATRVNNFIAIAKVPALPASTPKDQAIREVRAPCVSTRLTPHESTGR